MKEPKNLSRNTDLMAQSKTVLPIIGMGVTFGIGGDSYPYTVVAVADDYSWMDITSDSYTAAPGCEYYGNQTYMYSSNMNDPPRRIKLHIRGQRAGKYARGFHTGHRIYHQDPSF